MREVRILALASVMALATYAVIEWLWIRPSERRTEAAIEELRERLKETA